MEKYRSFCKASRPKWVAHTRLMQKSRRSTLTFDKFKENTINQNESIVMVAQDIKEESSWWRLQSSTSKNFSAAIDAMELVVNEGF
ncbi:hypothetical protein K435DRAFT_781380 [Dendrothele bispora CBS 962.96]|uniref:Uncharacterized protein n=1 Tax=Dendrothele bispora (strain CBS 962.96) TaxID=1314807 RepID=A0A4S8LL97_DENBC|nr:hypothetical protein K435DRAFT_781380 [Dendrothele bispora CBS 962.96]